MVGKTRQPQNIRSQERKKEAQDYEQKLLDVARVARVTAGGRRFSFRAVVVVGDRAGKVGVGVRKGRDVQFAVEKAVRDAKKNLFNAPMTDDGTIPYAVYGKSGSSRVFLKPARGGRGIRTGGAVRAVCDLAGYKSIAGKILSRSGNKLSVARAAVEALKKIKMLKGSSKPQIIPKKTKKDADSSTTKTQEAKKS